jgi:alpha-beta hydrolase superfamily lysophospholipase
MRSFSKPLRYVLPFGGAIVAGVLGLAAYTSYRLNAPRRRSLYDDFTVSPWEVQVPHELVSFQTDDGLTLRGWWLPQPDSKRVIVGFTGHRGAKHELLGIGSGLWRAGNNVLLFDFRGRGDSDVAPLSLVHNELPDARAALRYARERMPDARLGVIGYSMGAAVAILVAAADPTIQAVVADSPFASIRDVLTNVYQRRRLPPRFLLELSDVINRWRYGYQFEAVRPVDVVADIAPRPLFIIHGSADSLIPVEQGERLYAAAGEPKELWIVENAIHCGAYFLDRPGYVQRVTTFFEEALGE